MGGYANGNEELLRDSFLPYSSYWFKLRNTLERIGLFMRNKPTCSMNIVLLSISFLEFLHCIELNRSNRVGKYAVELSALNSAVSILTHRLLTSASRLESTLLTSLVNAYH
jgi:hypothetical protein